MRVVLAFSGGLDTSYCVAWLTRELGAEVSTVTVNTGGVTREELDRVAEQAKVTGAVAHHEIDARAGVFDNFVATLIRGNVLRGGLYPVSVAAERTQQAMEVARLARSVGADAVAHGSTGAGNDQIRFDVVFTVMLPSIPIITPIRDRGVTREQAIGYLTEQGLPVPSGAARYSVNQGLWGTTLGGGWTHDPWQGPPADAWPGEPGEPPHPEELVLGWENGLPISLDGAGLAGAELVETLSERVRPHRVGRGIHLGETALGIKGRIGFEAGAAVVLVHAHRELEKLVLTKWQMFWKDHLAQFWGDRLHEGQALDPVMRDIEALIASSQRRVTGFTRVRLESGSCSVTGVRSPHSLMNDGVARYGETNELWTGDEARAFAKIAAIPSLLAMGARGDDPW